jgi:Protein of unknown function (DUF1501)
VARQPLLLSSQLVAQPARRELDVRDDLHAAIVHLLGLDHRKLTYRYAGRNFRLTDVEGEVVQGLLA